MGPVSTRICGPNLVAVRRSCRKKRGGGYRQTDRQTDRQRFLQLYIIDNVIYIHPNFKHIQALLHICNIRSQLSKTRFVAHRVNLLTARPIKPYMVPSCGDLGNVLVNFAKTMLCFSKPWGPIIP